MSLDQDFTISTQPNTDGAWSLSVQSSAEQVYLNITATHDEEETTSNTTFIEINRTGSETETNQTNEGTENETENSTGNETGNNSDNGTDDNAGNQTGNNTGNQTDNGTEGPTGPTQPTYDPSDMGQFWLCLLYTSPSPRDATLSRMPSSA